jgi:phosphohistidine phosphatase SixA
MLITFFRHATAEPQTLLLNDAERTLIKKGKEQAIRAAQFCRKSALLPAALYCSPILRAQQTARIFQTHLPDCPPIHTVDWLSLNASIDGMQSELKKLAISGANDVWLVGHEPNISTLIADFLDAADDCILIKKASLTRIDADFTERPSGQLLWSIPSGLMR